jgi:hypothetical protein
MDTGADSLMTMMEYGDIWRDLGGVDGEGLAIEPCVSESRDRSEDDEALQSDSGYYSDEVFEMYVSESEKSEVGISDSDSVTDGEEETQEIDDGESESMNVYVHMSESRAMRAIAAGETVLGKRDRAALATERMMELAAREEEISESVKSSKRVVYQRDLLALFFSKVKGHKDGGLKMKCDLVRH